MPAWFTLASEPTVKPSASSDSMLLDSSADPAPNSFDASPSMVPVRATVATLSLPLTRTRSGRKVTPVTGRTNAPLPR
jgi:hypothetical protein